LCIQVLFGFMRMSIYIATSLDGFIAAKDGSLEWLTKLENPEGSDFGFKDFLRRIDAIVMGRNTYEFIKDYRPWPYDKPLFVLSSSLKVKSSLPLPEVESVHLNARELLSFLEKRGFQNIYIDGGKTINSFLREDLVDEMIISRVPVILGDGIPLFGKFSEIKYFKHIKTEVFSNGLTKSHYIKLS